MLFDACRRADESPAEGETLSGVPLGMRTVSGQYSGDIRMMRRPKVKAKANLSGKRTEHTSSVDVSSDGGDLQ